MILGPVQLLAYLLLQTFDGRLALSVAEVAALLGLSTRHVWSQVKAGAIPSIRSGRRLLIPIAGLDQFLRGEEVDGDE